MFCMLGTQNIISPFKGSSLLDRDRRGPGRGQESAKSRRQRQGFVAGPLSYSADTGRRAPAVNAASAHANAIHQFCHIPYDTAATAT